MHPVLREVQAREYSFWLALDNWQEIMQVVGLLEIPRLVLGVGLQVIALGLILKARIAWAFSLVLLIGVGTFAILGDSGHAGLGIYTLVLILALMAYWRRFDRASVTAGSLFALVSVLSLLIYAVFGTLYLGDEFNPPVHDAGTALYFSIVSMSTVGYGDITPHSGAARLFTASIIILGITVFATSVSAIAGPVIGGNLKRLVKGRFSTAMRKNHIIIAGATPLALSVYDGLRRRGDEVTVIVPAGVPQEYPATADLIEGDPSSVEVLRAAGVTRARYVLALRDDDAENAFIVLATQEATAGQGAKTVALVNTSKHLEKSDACGRTWCSRCSCWARSCWPAPSTANRWTARPSPICSSPRPARPPPNRPDARQPRSLAAVHVARQGHVGLLRMILAAGLPGPLRQQVYDIAAHRRRAILQVIAGARLQVGIGRDRAPQEIALAAGHVAQERAALAGLVVRDAHVARGPGASGVGAQAARAQAESNRISDRTWRRHCGLCMMIIHRRGV